MEHKSGTGSNATYEKGLAIRRQVVGDEYVDRALQNGSSDFARASAPVNDPTIC